MMSRYGVLSSDVLSIKVKQLDDEVSLRKLIDESLDEEILNASFELKEDEDGNRYFKKFTAWTESYVVSLVTSSCGDFLIKNNRE